MAVLLNTFTEKSKVSYIIQKAVFLDIGFNMTVLV